MQIDAPNAFSSFTLVSSSSDETFSSKDNGPREITFPSFFTLPTSETIVRLPFSATSCPVTGIVLLIGIPELPIVLSYSNPLSKGRNALAIAKLPGKTLEQLEPSILSGCILSLLTSANLLTSCFSLDSEAKQKEAAQDNTTISEIYSKETLIEILSSCGKIWENQRSILFRSIPEISGGNLSEIRDYVQDATKILFPESDERKAKEPIPLKAETKIPVRSSTVQPVAQFDIHVRLGIKKLSSEALADETISEKAFSLIQKHCDTSEKLSLGQKMSLISYLLSCEAKALADLVKRMPISTSEEIIDEISPSELAEKEDITEKKERKTALQMLAEWKAARAAKAVGGK